MSKFATQCNSDSSFGSYLHYKGKSLAAVAKDILGQRAFEARNKMDEDVLDQWEQEDLAAQMEEEELKREAEFRKAETEKIRTNCNGLVGSGVCDYWYNGKCNKEKGCYYF